MAKKTMQPVVLPPNSQAHKFPVPASATVAGHAAAVAPKVAVNNHAQHAPAIAKAHARVPMGKPGGMGTVGAAGMSDNDADD